MVVESISKIEQINNELIKKNKVINDISKMCDKVQGRRVNIQKDNNRSHHIYQMWVGYFSIQYSCCSFSNQTAREGGNNNNSTLCFG